MVKINGQAYDFDGKALAEVITDLGYDPKRIAVEQNGEIVPKARYGETLLKEGDSLEVVSFVGGG